MKPKNKRQSSRMQKSTKRGIHVKGSWKAVELDPSLFSEEGMEGLVCFEELTNYRLVDSEKAAAKAAKALKREKRTATKRTASEREEGEEKGDVDGQDGEKTAEPAKKKAKKKKKKKNKKQSAEESTQQDISTEVTQKDLAAREDEEDQTSKEEASKEAANTSKEEVQSTSAKKSNKKNKKKQKQQIENDSVTEKQPDPKPSSELQAAETEKIPQDKATKPQKKQVKNWTNRALSGSDDKNTDVSAWKNLFVPSLVLKALSSLGFGSPTPIQALTLPPAIRDRMDILGAAETGELNISVLASVQQSVSKLLQVKLM